MAVVWNAENAAHLLRRATFGAPPAAIDRAVRAGLGMTVAGLFRPPEPDALNTRDVYLNQFQAWWLRRMLATRAPLVEKLTLMWHNHFATGYHKVSNTKFMHLQNQILRRNALGSFPTLVEQVSKSAAMLIWLDGATNTKDDPNENFARELMELFTTGVFDRTGAPTYTELDVVEGARAFTGWSFNWRNGAFRFNEWDHDGGLKTFRGQTGPFGGEDVIAMLAEDPATARRVAWRLWSTFAAPVDLDDPVLDALEAEYLARGLTIRPVVELMFTRDEFYAPAVRQARVKNPCEWLVGSMALLGGRFNRAKAWMDWALGESIQYLGQSIADPPSVFGWKEHLAWVSSNGLFSRLRAGEEIASGREPGWQLFLWNPLPLLPPRRLWAAQTAASTVDWMLARLGPVAAQSTTRDALVAYLNMGANGQPEPFVLNRDTIDSKVRGLVALILACPEYQFC